MVAAAGVLREELVAVVGRCGAVEIVQFIRYVTRIRIGGEAFEVRIADRQVIVAGQQIHHRVLLRIIGVDAQRVRRHRAHACAYAY